MTIYQDGEYLAQNPTWHEQDSPWKAEAALGLLQKQSISPTRICDVGCGTGAFLQIISERLPSAECVGFDIAAEPIERAKARQNGRLTFHCADPFASPARYDLTFAIDVVEHIPDYLGFLNRIRQTAPLCMLHIPLEMTASAVIRRSPFEIARASVGHLHYFSLDTALASLREAGLKIIDWSYTAQHALKPNVGLKTRLAIWPRTAAFVVSPDTAVRLFGGYSLMVLCSSE